MDAARRFFRHECCTTGPVQVRSLEDDGLVESRECGGGFDAKFLRKMMLELPVGA